MQVFVIHGGHARESYEDYLEHLIKKSVTLEDLRGTDWKRHLSKNLGEGYEVYLAQMPNKENAKYAEWKIWFEKFIPQFDDGIVFVGHSLGGIFLAKYLSENTFPKKIAGVCLVAAPYNTLTEHPRADFNILTPLTLFEEQAQRIFVYHSTDDRIVPYSNLLRYQKELPKATVRVFDSKGHFNGEDFPDIVHDIRNLQESS